jgi:uncharacterized protein YcnI
MRRIYLVTFGAVGLLFLTAVGASAHVEFSPDSTLAGKKVSLQIMVPHDCSDKSKTQEIKMQLPKNLDATSFVPGSLIQHGKVVKSWSMKIVKSKGLNYLDFSGPAIQAGPDMGKNSLTFKFGFTTPKQSGVQLQFPTVQYCTNGLSISWIQPRPMDGSDPSEMSKPVPVLNLK